MLRTLLATTAFALSAGAALAGNWYVATFGGANWKEPYGSYDGPATINIDPDAGYLVGGAVGRKLDDIGLPGFRTELEISYRENAISGEFDSWCYDTDVNGHDSTFAAMANIAYDLPEVLTIRPYVMAGAGLASRRISLTPVPDNFLHNGVGTDRTGFAWQVGAGFRHDVSENISIGVGYRYFESIGLNREVVYGKNTANMTADGDNHAVIAEVVFGLD